MKDNVNLVQLWLWISLKEKLLLHFQFFRKPADILNLNLLIFIQSSKDLREKINLKDNLFLDRYAQSVTENGEQINTNDSSIIGYGVWRLTEEDFVHILSVSRDNKFKYDVPSVTTNLFANVENGCGQISNLTESIELAELL